MWKKWLNKLIYRLWVKRSEAALKDSPLLAFSFHVFAATVLEHALNEGGMLLVQKKYDEWIDGVIERVLACQLTQK